MEGSNINDGTILLFESHGYTTTAIANHSAYMSKGNTNVTIYTHLKCLFKIYQICQLQFEVFIKLSDNDIYFLEECLTIFTKFIGSSLDTYRAEKINIAEANYGRTFQRRIAVYKVNKNEKAMIFQLRFNLKKREFSFLEI